MQTVSPAKVVAPVEAVEEPLPAACGAGGLID
jgi:hypothetical protein